MIRARGCRDEINVFTVRLLLSVCTITDLRQCYGKNTFMYSAWLIAEKRDQAFSLRLSLDKMNVLRPCHILMQILKGHVFSITLE